MTREILFRAKRIDNGEWIQGAALMMDDGTYKIATSCIADIEQNTPLIVAAYDVNTDTVSQYTGLTDKNGTKIFENDYIKYRNEHVGKITWRDGCFIVEWEKSESRDLRQDLAFWCRKRKIEVIGNIFDNQTAEDGEI